MLLTPAALAFIRQNPLSAPGVTVDALNTYARHHSGGLVVLSRDSTGPGRRMVKLHDTWGDEGTIVVHRYDADEDDPTESVDHFTDPAAALAAFLTDTPTPIGVDIQAVVGAPVLVSIDTQGRATITVDLTDLQNPREWQRDDESLSDEDAHALSCVAALVVARTGSGFVTVTEV